jgi:hypothetical protein
LLNATPPEQRAENRPPRIKPTVTPEQIAKLPAPAQSQSGAPSPQGAVRSYPPLESGTR